MVSAQCKHELEYVLSRLLITLLFSMSSVILMLRTYAFSGVKKWILAVLSIVLLGFVGVTIWVTIKQLARLSR
jgi:predicted membrane-bound spermidine synthase